LRDEKLDIIWTCNGRVDTIDDEMLGEMKQSGCRMIRVGVESGSQEVLDKIKKGLTLEQIETGIGRIKKHKIQWFFYRGDRFLNFSLSGCVAALLEGTFLTSDI